MSEQISPLPWVSLSPVDFDSIRLFSGSNYIGCIGCSDGPRETTEANAEYIVRSVNAHAGLETALRIAVDAMSQATWELNGKNCSDLNYAIDKARAALAQAK
jgi:hypothetical protein